MTSSGACSHAGRAAVVVAIATLGNTGCARLTRSSPQSTLSLLLQNIIDTMQTEQVKRAVMVLQSVLTPFAK
jgi:hypothetical protein